MRRPPAIFQVTGSLLVAVSVALLTFALAGCTAPAGDLMTLGSAPHSLAPVSDEEAIVRQAIAAQEIRHP